MWLVLLSCATSPEPPKTLEAPLVPVVDDTPADPCQQACEQANQARSVAWEQIVADCRAQCAAAETTPTPTSYTGVVTKTISGGQATLYLQLPDGTALELRTGVDVQVGQPATLTAEQLVLP